MNRLARARRRRLTRLVDHALRWGALAFTIAVALFALAAGLAP